MFDNFVRLGIEMIKKNEFLGTKQVQKSSLSLDPGAADLQIL